MLVNGISSHEVRETAILATRYSDSDKISSIYDFVKAHTKYTPDPLGMELFISPQKMIEKIRMTGIAEGDCDDLSLLTAALLGSIGYSVRLALVDLEGYGFDHIFCQVYSENLQAWLNCDTSSSNPVGWEIQYRKGEYIVV